MIEKTEKVGFLPEGRYWVFVGFARTFDAFMGYEIEFLFYSNIVSGLLILQFVHSFSCIHVL